MHQLVNFEGLEKKEGVTFKLYTGTFLDSEKKLRVRFTSWCWEMPDLSLGLLPGAGLGGEEWLSFENHLHSYPIACTGDEPLDGSPHEDSPDLEILVRLNIQQRDGMLKELAALDSLLEGRDIEAEASDLGKESVLGQDHLNFASSSDVTLWLDRKAIRKVKHDVEAWLRKPSIDPRVRIDQQRRAAAEADMFRASIRSRFGILRVYEETGVIMVWRIINELRTSVRAVREPLEMILQELTAHLRKAKGAEKKLRTRTFEDRNEKERRLKEAEMEVSDTQWYRDHLKEFDRECRKGVIKLPTNFPLHLNDVDMRNLRVIMRRNSLEPPPNDWLDRTPVENTNAVNMAELEEAYYQFIAFARKSWSLSDIEIERLSSLLIGIDREMLSLLKAILNMRIGFPTPGDRFEDFIGFTRDALREMPNKENELARLVWNTKARKSMKRCWERTCFDLEVQKAPVGGVERVKEKAPVETRASNEKDQKGRRYDINDLADRYVRVLHETRMRNPSQLLLVEKAGASQTTWSRMSREPEFWSAVKGIIDSTIDVRIADKDFLIEVSQDVDDRIQKSKTKSSKERHSETLQNLSTTSDILDLSRLDNPKELDKAGLIREILILRPNLNRTELEGMKKDDLDLLFQTLE